MADFATRIMQAATDLANAVSKEMALEDNRHNVKLGAIERIMASGDNKLTGKPHSFSSAESMVSTDGTYADYLEQLRSATRDRILAKGAYDAAIAASRLQEALNA
jgi:hypothetical protein